MSSRLEPYHDQIQAMCDAGVSLQGMSDQLLLDHGLSISANGLRNYIMSKNMVRVIMCRGQPPALTDKQATRLRKQKATGMSYSALMEYWRISRPTVWRYLKLG